jgi:hypothetical protein
MKISYAITVCNEFIEIQRLVNFLLRHKRVQDNIVILFDEANGDPEVENFLRTHSINGEFSWHKGKFDRHFADWKNKLTGFCNGDYIFQIDADEIPNENLIAVLPELLEENNEVDVFLVPRVNTVEGLTPEHIAKWGWRVNDAGWVNWPDIPMAYLEEQARNRKWINKVHERLDGFKTIYSNARCRVFCFIPSKNNSETSKTKSVI